MKGMTQPPKVTVATIPRMVTATITSISVIARNVGRLALIGPSRGEA